MALPKSLNGRMSRVFRDPIDLVSLANSNMVNYCADWYEHTSHKEEN